MDANLKPMINIKNHSVFSYVAPEDPEEPGTYVYHYTRWERLLNIMDTGFRLSVLAYMNDPRESKDWNLSTVSYEPAPMVDEPAFNRAVADYKRRIRVGAFCLDQPSGAAGSQGHRGYAHPRMWAQYAENHKGVCIVMSRDILNQAIRTKYRDQNGSWVEDGKVRYVDTVPEDPATQAVKFDQEEYHIESTVRNHFTKFRDSMFFVKHVDWRDENEYRWVYYDADESGTGSNGNKSPFVDIKHSVAALVLGQDYADAHLPVARMFAESHGLNGDIVRCQWDRLNLHLIRFADDGNHWIAVENDQIPRHWGIGKPRLVPFTPDAQ